MQSYETNNTFKQCSPLTVMATSHQLSDIILGQAGGSEFGVIGNVAE
jgi:hypothetical protein